MSVWLPYVVPFGLFGILTYAGPLLHLSPALVYPVKTLVTGIALYHYRGSYGREIRPSLDLWAIGAGILVFLLWVLLDPFYPKVTPDGLNPSDHASGVGLYLFIATRLAGAALIVPVMEELFWRSFAMRYLVGNDFRKVALGQFTWFSFGVVALAFGLEHHRWLAGILAGIVYGLLLVRTKNLFSPILSHGVTNLLLGGYVLATEQWIFW